MLRSSLHFKLQDHLLLGKHASYCKLKDNILTASVPKAVSMASTAHHCLWGHESPACMMRSGAPVMPVVMPSSLRRAAGVIVLEIRAIQSSWRFDGVLCASPGARLEADATSGQRCAEFEAAYGVSAPLPDFVKQRQIAAGKRAADAPAEEASLETLSMEGNSFSVAKEAAMPCCQMCEETAFWLSR